MWDHTCAFTIWTFTRGTDIIWIKLRKRTNHKEKSGLDNVVKDRFISGSGLKKGMENGIFWSEIGSGSWEPCGTPPPKIPGSISLPIPQAKAVSCHVMTEKPAKFIWLGMKIWSCQPRSNIVNMRLSDTGFVAHTVPLRSSCSTRVRRLSLYYYGVSRISLFSSWSKKETLCLFVWSSCIPKFGSIRLAAQTLKQVWAVYQSVTAFELIYTVVQFQHFYTTNE